MIALLGLSLGVIIVGISMIVFGYRIQAEKAEEAQHRAWKAEMELRDYMKRHEETIYQAGAYQAEARRSATSERQPRAVNLGENEER